MTRMELGTIISGALSALAIIIAAVATARGNARAKHVEATAVPYSDMGERLDKALDRIDKLEARVQTLTELQWVDRRWILDAASTLARHGIAMPQPTPPWLVDHPGTPSPPKE